MEVSETVKNEILANLRRLGGGAARSEDVIYGEDNKIRLPQAFNRPNGLLQVASFLQQLHKDQMAETTASRTFKYRPWDGAVALVNVLEAAFGAVLHKRKIADGLAGMFGMTDPPELRSIPVSLTENIQVPWGPLAIPLLDGLVLTPDEVLDPEHGMVFHLTAIGPRMYAEEVEGIFNAIEVELKDNSIYRGKAFDGAQVPNFIDLDIDRNLLAFPLETLVQLDAKVYGPIRHAKALAAVGVSGKKSILLKGPFGTGKTSTGMIAGQESIAAGRTFIYARPGKDDMEAAFKTGRMYGPATIFCEDVDTEVETTDQGGISRLLDLFDGLGSKGDVDVIAILTTNYPENIVKGMVRPGRLDSIVHLGNPDAAAIEKIVKNILPADLLQSVKWEPVVESMQGNPDLEDIDGNRVDTTYLPAYVAQAAKDAVSYSVARNNGENDHPLTTEDLIHAAVGLREHWALQQDAPEHTPADSLGVATEKLVKAASTEATVDVINMAFPGRLEE